MTPGFLPGLLCGFCLCIGAQLTVRGFRGWMDARRALRIIEAAGRESGEPVI